MLDKTYLPWIIDLLAEERGHFLLHSRDDRCMMVGDKIGEGENGRSEDDHIARPLPDEDLLARV